MMLPVDIVEYLKSRGTYEAYKEAEEFALSGEVLWGTEVPANIAAFVVQVSEPLSWDLGNDGRPVEECRCPHSYVEFRSILSAYYPGRYMEYAVVKAIMAHISECVDDFPKRVPPEGYPFMALMIDELLRVAVCRATVGADIGWFFERVFRIYQSGGMPCGYAEFEGFVEGRPVNMPKLLAWYPGIPRLAERGEPSVSYTQWYRDQQRQIWGE